MNERDRIRNWLKALLDSAPRGTKSQLADAMGIRREALSRMISGTGEAREVTAVELARAAEFFRVPLPDFRGSRDAPPTVPLISWVSAGRLAELAASPSAITLAGDHIVYAIHRSTTATARPVSTSTTASR